MKKLVTLFLFFISFITFAQSVVVNKYQNNTIDVVELLVIQDNLDMRGMIIKDFSSSMANDGGGKYTFSANALWSSVKSGTLIVLRKNNTAADINGTDFSLDIGLDNTTYFTASGTFDIAGTEMIMIKAAGSGVSGTAGSIHALAGGTAGAQFTGAPTPKLRASGTSATGNFVFANNSSSSLSDYNGTDATGSSTGLVFGSGNNATNTTYINSLRNGNSGGGASNTIALENQTEVSPANLPSEDENFSASITATSDTGIVAVYLKFSKYSNGTQSAPDSVSATSTDVNIYSAEIPESFYNDGDLVEFWFAATDSGSFRKESLKGKFFAGLTPIANAKKANADGTMKYKGAYVKISAVALINSEILSTANLDVHLQDATGGINLFKFSVNPPIVRGNSYTVTGILDQYNGKSEITPDNTDTDIIDNGASSLPEPIVKTIAELNASGENYEGMLVGIQHISKDATSVDSWPSSILFVNKYVITDDGGTSKLTLRINTVTAGSKEPKYPQDIIGIFSQFDSSSPFDSGYQFFTRDSSDFQSIIVVDTTKPTPVIATVQNDTTLSIQFSEKIDSTTAVDIANYSISNDVVVKSVSWISNAQQFVTLTVSILSEGDYTVSISNIADKSGNIIEPGSTLNFTVSGGGGPDYMPIVTAKTLALGTVVTVAGRVTVANELGGPSYFQDETSGMAIFETPFHTAVAEGDSVVITGPLTEYGQKNSTSPYTTPDGDPGTGLFQISGAGITYQVFKNVNKPVIPKVITVSQIGEDLEGQLVQIKNATIGFTGAFGSNKNYDLSDNSGTLKLGLRIDNSTNLVGATAPTVPSNIVGVVSQFLGNYQVLPRSTKDVNVIVFKIPYENIPLDSTLDIVTWNCEWLGYGGANFGPIDDILQAQNVARVMKTLKADLYGIQEMSSNTAWQTILDSLPDYGGVVAPISETQKMAYVYKKSVIKPVSNSSLFTTGDWASGRWPFEFIFDYVQGGKSNRINAVNIHAKATTTAPQSDYERRVVDAEQLKTFFDTNRSTEKLILLGDYNDNLNFSNVGSNQPSPYAAFVSDAANYRAVSKLLTDRGLSTSSGANPIDHMIVSNELAPAYLDSTIRVENVSFIPSYISTTSDHYPVRARFKFADGTSVSVGERTELSETFMLYGNYPNPFNPTTQLRFSIPGSGNVDISVFNLLGQKVGSVFSSNLNKGYHEIQFDGSKLSSGVYYYSVQFNGTSKTAKFILSK